MNRLMRSGFLPVVLVLLSLAALGCGGAARQSTAVPSTANPEQPRPTAPEPPAPTSDSAPAPTPGALTDLENQLELRKNLPGYHYEGVLRVNEAGKSPQYLKVIEDVDANGNMRTAIYDAEGGAPAVEFYYVDGHVYTGQAGMFVDLGVQSGDQLSIMLQAYQLPFQLFFIGAVNLQPAGADPVDGQAATRYTANFDRAVASYAQVKQGVAMSSEGTVWVSDQYGVVLKTEVRSTWTKDDQQSSLESQTEITQVGRVAPITAPK